MSVPVKIFGEHEDRVVQQLMRCADPEVASAAVLCADAHFGYSMPIGGVVAYPGHVSPSGVGFDIACGNKAVLTDVALADLTEDHKEWIPEIADEIQRRISFGVGRKNKEPAEHEVLDKIRDAPILKQKEMYDLAAASLGTVGAGNHYVDVFADEQDRIWVGVHFGSRGFGWKTAAGFMNLAAGKGWDDGKHQGEYEAPPLLLSTDSLVGQDYIAAMQLAGEYAYAGRDLVCDKVCEILGAKQLDEVHNHHNFAWREPLAMGDAWVVRKGATPAYHDQRGFVGSTMGEESVIVRGTEHLESLEALNSTVHGAGRVMSRTEAAGKFAKNLYECMDRDCERTFRIEGVSSHNGPPKRGVCPDHPEARVKKTRRKQRIGGKIDWEKVRNEMRIKGIELRGGAADEAPGAYKRLDEVLAEHEGTIEIMHRLRPLIVVMAGDDVKDPWKD